MLIFKKNKKMQIPLTSSLIREEFLDNPFNNSNKAGGCTRLQAKSNSFRAVLFARASDNAEHPS
jgi:hypothetical protein